MKCSHCQSSFEITDQDRKFYGKIGVPEPTLCQICRMQRRFMVRNERSLYTDKCDLCGKKIISAYSQDKTFTVYCHECFWSDKWDVEKYAQDFDFNRPFFEQFEELQKNVPRCNLAIVNSQNCDYCNYIADAKDCYLCFGTIHAENCLYGSPYESRDCVDTFLARECELCYECTDCEKLFSCMFCKDCANGANLIFCYDCKGCKDCIGCALLRNKQYYIFNKPYSKEEYEKKKAELNTGSYTILQALKNKFQNHLSKYPRKFAEQFYSEDVTGNYIVKSKNSWRCFDSKELWDCAYCAQVIDGKDSYDINYCEHFELCYDYLGYDDNYNIQFSNTCGFSKNVLYSAFCHACDDIFGCIALRDKKYCILNKSYSKEEYKELKLKIIKYMWETKEWGEFFPLKIAPFGYNESVNQQYFPLTEERAKAKGYRWKEKDKGEYQPQTYKIPDDIKNVSDKVCQQVLACTDCGKNYKIISQELRFYKNQFLPIPHKCPDCRHQDRLVQRTPRGQLWNRKCDKCGIELQGAYAPDCPETVYCEKCYLETVV